MRESCSKHTVFKEVALGTSNALMGRGAEKLMGGMRRGKVRVEIF